MTASNTSEPRPLVDELTGALRFIIAFYEPGQTYLDTNAWKVAEAGGRAALAKGEAFLSAQAASAENEALALRTPSDGEVVALPERDWSRPTDRQGLFRKFDVRRVDGSDEPGRKHHGCRYFVLDVDHDPHAVAALDAYATACETTHPDLANDLRNKWVRK